MSPEGRDNSTHTTINKVDVSRVVPSRSSFDTNPCNPDTPGGEQHEKQQKQPGWRREGGKTFRGSKNVRVAEGGVFLGTGQPDRKNDTSGRTWGMKPWRGGAIKANAPHCKREGA